MLSKQEKANLRSRLFQHLDGIVTAPSAYALKKNGVCDYLLQKKTATLDELCSHFNANDGYLNVALRVLCSQGWLKQNLDNRKDQVTFSINEASAFAFEQFQNYKDAVALLRLSEQYHPRKFELEPFLKLKNLHNQHRKKFGMTLSAVPSEKAIQYQLLHHIEGIILGPTLVLLGMAGMFHKYFMQTRFRAEEFHADPENFEQLLDILTEVGHFTKSNGSFQFTEQGLFFAKRASSYGVTVSYIPTLRKLDELIFGNALVLEKQKGDTEEKHVDREMNVWGSGGAHAAYFKVVDEIVIALFNKPISEQPTGILDMGCGNGAFLQHLFSVIETQTLRGTMLDEYPLMLIGADFNEKALEVSRKNLIQAEIWAKIIWGDIGDPDALASDLDQKYGVKLGDLLNVRTFLDHNRIWEAPKNKSNLRISTSTGAYATKGKRINNNLISESLKEHFKKWSPYLKKFGLLLIELHTVPPELVAKNLGKTAATAYDATHGYSDQYIIEVDEFNTVLKEAGFVQDLEKFRKFPDSDLASVSINLLKST